MTILLLGGTYEGREIARALDLRGANFISSLSGATRSRAAIAGRLRVGGFGGDDGFRAFLSSEGISAIIDATHPFAARISERTARIARESDIPCLHVVRPEWTAQPGDNWTFVDDEAEVADLVPSGAVVFAATGRQTLARFANLGHAWLIMRQIDPPEAPFPYENGEFLVGRPPFSVADEIALFRQRRVDVLVAKNAGGEMSATKLIAARELGLPVILVRRPTPPAGERTGTVQGALDWLSGLDP